MCNDDEEGLDNDNTGTLYKIPVGKIKKMYQKKNFIKKSKTKDAA